MVARTHALIVILVMADLLEASMFTLVHLAFPTQLAVGVLALTVFTHQGARQILAADFKPTLRSVPILYRHLWVQLGELKAL